jgi:hypothetical protein
MRKKVIAALMLSAIMLANVVSVAAQTIPQSGTTTIVPNRLTVTWEDESRDDVTIDTFRFFGFNVAQLRTMVNVLDGSVANLADGTFQINQEGAPVGFTPITFRQATDIDYIINTTPIRNHEGARVFPSQPGWVFLPEHEYNWASVRDVINSMGLELIDVEDDPAAGHTLVTVRRPEPPGRPPSGPAVNPPGNRPGWGGWRDPWVAPGTEVRDIYNRATGDWLVPSQGALRTTEGALLTESRINSMQSEIDAARERVRNTYALDSATYVTLMRQLDDAQAAVDRARYQLAEGVVYGTSFWHDGAWHTHPAALRSVLNDLDALAATTSGAALEAAVRNAQEWVDRAANMANAVPNRFPYNATSTPTRQQLIDRAADLRLEFAQNATAYADEAMAGLAAATGLTDAEVRSYATHVETLINLANTAVGGLPSGADRNGLNSDLYAIRQQLSLFRAARPSIFI